MELFAIHCQTCQARLKVRNATIIGDIVACPKCGSMVLVEAPEGWEGAAEPVAAAAEAPPKKSQQSGPPRNGAARSNPPAKPRSNKPQPAEKAPRTSTFTAGPPAGAEADYDPSGDTIDGSRPNISREELQPETQAPPALPPAAGAANSWNPSANSPAKQIVFAVGAGVLGLVLAVGMFVALLRAFASPNDPVAQNDPTDQTEVSADNDPNADSSDIADSSTDGDTPAADTTEPVTPTDTVEPTDDGEEPAVDSTEPTDGGDPAAPTDDGAEPVDPPVEPATDDGEETPFGDGDEDGGETLDPPPAAGVDDPLFSRFADLIDASPTRGTDVEDPGGEDPGPIETIEDDVRMTRPHAITVAAAERLTDPVAAIEFPAAPLLEFVNFMSNYANTPITIDPWALKESQATPASALSVDLNNATVAEILNTAFEPLDIHILARERDAYVTRLAPADELPKKSFPIGDLAKTGAEKSRLTTMITELIEPKSWASGGGKGQIEVIDEVVVLQNRTDIQFRALVLLEKLRIARGLKPASRFQPETFALKSRTSRAKAILAKPLTINFGYGEKLTTVLQRVHDETGLWVLVDWRSVADEGWNHHAEVEFIAQEETVGDALGRLASNMDLALRIIDSNMVQLVSTKAYQQEHEVELYETSMLPDGDSAALLARIEKELGDGWFQPVGGGAMFIDEPSGALVVSLPQPQQRDLATLLKAWRTE